MEVLQMFRRKAEKRMVELSPDEARLLREALLAFRNKLLSAGKPTEDVNELIIKVMKWQTFIFPICISGMKIFCGLITAPLRMSMR